MILNRFLLLCCPAGRLKSPGSAADERCWIWQRFNVSLSRTLHPSRRSATQQLPAEGAVKPARLQLWIASVQLRFTQRGGKRSYHPLTTPHAVGRSCSTTSPVITCDFLSLSHLLPLQWFHCSQTTNNKLQLAAKRHDRVPSSIDWGLKMLPPSQEMEVKLKSELRLE